MRQFLDHRRLRRSDEVVSAHVDPDRAAAATNPATRVTLLQALATLSVRDRAIVVLRYWEDQSVAATADAIGITPELVRTRCVRALAQLRERLGTDVELLRT